MILAYHNWYIGILKTQYDSQVKSPPPRQKKKNRERVICHKESFSKILPLF